MQQYLISKKELLDALDYKKLFFWNEQGDTPELIEADDIERIALDADRS